jgi:hypothetical protein
MEHEANHPPPISAEVVNGWNYTFSTPYIFMAWWLIN